ncbi:MAG TPA: TIGR04222 domain-containing membrane protein [Actinophytocola sp.]|uniref:TIGR04222 domain-containing membrane protein n=1 Tax=Actinophytocola sp. TaxID=1872138 RepID=UPI002DBD7C3F|nr:TIGR04222 domain-containing membrane protein [Actinophytocola sp.]HEU5471121.1 TIGR04222 domain-containing membrane protein [Actinophytocola sp.]
MDALLITALLVVAAALLLLPPAAKSVDLLPTEIGYLNRGGRGAVATALTVLYTADLLEIRYRSTVERSDKPLPSRSELEPFVRAVYTDIHVQARPGALPSRPAVRRGLAALAARLADAGLVPGRFRLLAGRTVLAAAVVLAIVRLAARSGAGEALLALIAGAVVLWRLSRRTIAGHRLLRRLRRDYTRRWSGTPDDDPAPAAGVALVPGHGAPVDAAALGLVASLGAVIGIHVPDFGGWDNGGGGGGDGDGGGGF